MLFRIDSDLGRLEKQVQLLTSASQRVSKIRSQSHDLSCHGGNSVVNALVHTAGWPDDDGYDNISVMCVNYFRVTTYTCIAIIYSWRLDNGNLLLAKVYTWMKFICS